MAKALRDPEEVYGKSLEDGLAFYNPWWTGKVPEYLVKEYRRDVFYRIKGYLDINRIIAIKGPRRVGKTSLMYQLIEDLLETTPANRIMYAPFDDVKIRDFDAVIDYYERMILKESLGERQVYLFLDEAQFLPGWENQVKKYYDRNYPIKFIVSGSSATLIKKNTESLMGRTVEETILPFSFKDMLQYKLKEKITLNMEETDIVKIKKYEKDARIVFDEYLLKGGFPNIFEVTETDLWQKLVKEDIIDKALYRDIVTLYDIKRPEILEKLFLYLAGINGQILDVSNVSSSLGLSREYISKYVQYLKNAYLLIGLRKYSNSIEKTVRSNEKTYVTDPGIVNALLNRKKLEDDETGRMVEAVIAAHLYGKEYYYWRDRYEVDFIVKSPEGSLPIEVKYKNQVRKKDLSGLLEYMRKNEVKEGMVVTKDYSGEEEIEGRRIKYVPTWRFLIGM